MKTYADVGVQVPRIYLPKGGTDLSKWAVIACDQYTSEPEYWQNVETLVGNHPSTYNLVLPEVFLEKAGLESRINHIQDRMLFYLEHGIFNSRDGMIFVERRLDGKIRRGLMLCLDLECFDYNKGSTSLIRSTEGTILERLPPRMKIRSGAALELPHILVLIDDPLFSVIEPVEKNKAGLEQLYDFDLMLGSGHLTGYHLTQTMEEQVVASLRRLAEPAAFATKYGLSPEQPVLLFAMGDGNHSLATAKAVWEKLKPEVGMDHPARYALVEVENVHDQGLDFQPIHRLLFNVRKDIISTLGSTFGSGFTYKPVSNETEMVNAVDNTLGVGQTIGMVGGGRGYGCIEISTPTSNLAVGTLQNFLDNFILEMGAVRIDYIHGRDTLIKLGLQAGNAGFYLPCIHKSDLFKTVILEGALPRKTFSMGEASEKRFYMEARKIL